MRSRPFALAVAGAALAALSAGVPGAAASTAVVGDEISMSIAPSTVVAGSAPTVTTTLTRLNGTPITGRTMRLYARPAGSSAYTLLTWIATNSSGVATFAPKPVLTTTYQARFAGDGTYASISGPALTVGVAPRVTASPLQSTVAKGAGSAVTGSVYPGRPGATLSVQRVISGTWSTFGTTTLSSTSTYRVTLTPPSTGTWAYRLTIPADATHL